MYLKFKYKCFWNPVEGRNRYCYLATSFAAIVKLLPCCLLLKRLRQQMVIGSYVGTWSG